MFPLVGPPNSICPRKSVLWFGTLPHGDFASILALSRDILSKLGIYNLDTMLRHQPKYHIENHQKKKAASLNLNLTFEQHSIHWGELIGFGPTEIAFSWKITSPALMSFVAIKHLKNRKKGWEKFQGTRKVVRELSRSVYLDVPFSCYVVPSKPLIDKLVKLNIQMSWSNCSPTPLCQGCYDVQLKVIDRHNNLMSLVNVFGTGWETKVLYVKT